MISNVVRDLVSEQSAQASSSPCNAWSMPMVTTITGCLSLFFVAKALGASGLAMKIWLA